MRYVLELRALRAVRAGVLEVVLHVMEAEKDVRHAL